MRGTVLQYDPDKGGIISGTDGNRYSFDSGEFLKNERLGIAGTEIDFDLEDRRAFDLIIIKGAVGERKRWAAVWLAALLGPFGADRFYLRRNDEGRAILAIFLGLLIGNNLLFGAGQGTNWIWLIFIGWAWIRAAIYLAKSDQEFFETYLSTDARKRAGYNA